MIRLHAWITGLLVLSASGSALAQDSSGGDKQFKLGLRLGYGIPAGSVSGTIDYAGQTVTGSKLSDAVSGQVPIWIDAGYMVTPNVLLGLYGQYGFVSVKDCSGCSSHDVRLGVQAQYHVMPNQAVDPWFGLGIGYEWLGESETDEGVTVDTTIKGLELLNLQGGADFQVANAVTLGPFLSVSLGEYSGVSSGGTTIDFDNKAVHEWITIGAKGTFGL